MTRLLPAAPIGTRRAVAHLHYADRPHEWREVEMPVYRDEDGCALRDARVAAGMTIREAARRLGLSAVDYSGLERGRYTVEDWGEVYEALGIARCRDA